MVTGRNHVHRLAGALALVVLGTALVLGVLALRQRAAEAQAVGGGQSSGQQEGTAGGARTGAGGGDVRAGAAGGELVAAGEQLYLTGCVSCHGVRGAGTTNGPSLEAAGEAAADFYLRTGRMPLAAPAVQALQKPVAYDDAQIRALVAYVGSLGNGPRIPEVDESRGEVAEGSQLYLANCAACHNSAGIGGALSYGAHAPSLWSVEPTQIAEAVRIGPGQMPVFGPETLSDQQVDSIVRYVRYLQEPEHPGGLSLGGAGPVPEGFVAWTVGIGVLLLLIRWITRDHA